MAAGRRRPPKQPNRRRNAPTTDAQCSTRAHATHVCKAVRRQPAHSKDSLPPPHPAKMPKWTFELSSIGSRPLRPEAMVIMVEVSSDASAATALTAAIWPAGLEWVAGGWRRRRRRERPEPRAGALGGCASHMTQRTPLSLTQEVEPPGDPAGPGPEAAAGQAELPVVPGGWGRARVRVRGFRA